MKTLFSTKWKSSKQPRKQRKYQANAPLHIKEKFIRSHLSKELRKKYGTRNIRVRKGDKVRIMVGEYKNKDGKVERVDVKKCKVFVDVAYREKRDGGKHYYPLEASNLMLLELYDKDKRRFAKPKQTQVQDQQDKHKKIQQSDGKQEKQTAKSQNENKNDSKRGR